MGTVSEYISRDTILKVLADCEPKEEDWRTDNMEGYDLRKIRYLAASNVYEEIKDVLSCKRLIADVAPVVHGRWEVVYNSVGKQEGQCTHCGKNSGILITKKSYCPNCGAKMDEEGSGNRE